MFEGDRGRAVLPYQRQPAGTAQQCESKQPAIAQRSSVCGGTRLQVAGASEAVLPLAHDLYAYEPVGEERDIGRVFEQLQLEQIVRIGIEAFSLDSLR